MKTNTLNSVSAILALAALLFCSAYMVMEHQFRARKAAVNAETAFIHEHNGSDATGIVGRRDMPFQTAGALLDHHATYGLLIGDKNEAEQDANMEEVIWNQIHPWLAQKHRHLLLHLSLCLGLCAVFLNPLFSLLIYLRKRGGAN